RPGHSIMKLRCARSPNGPGARYKFLLTSALPHKCGVPRAPRNAAFMRQGRGLAYGLAIGFAGLGGGAQQPESRASRPVSAAPSSVRQHFASVDTVVLTAKAREIEAHWDYRLEEVELRSATEQAAGNSGIVVDYYRPKGAGSPVVLLLPMA